MKYAIPILAFAGACLAQDGSEAGYEYFQEVCSPYNSTGYPDFNAPCNAIEAIETQCIFGSDYFQQTLAALNDGSSSEDLRRRALRVLKRQFSDDTTPPVQSNETQRICFCESQFFDQANGCAACAAKHGNPDLDFGIGSADDLASLSSSYCAVSNTPTQGFTDVAFSYANSVAPTSSPTAGSAFHDPLGNMTQVSLYFTPQVTGTAAWIVAAESGSAAGTMTSVNTHDGQIRPTAGPDATASGNAAMRTEAVAAAGVVGFAGLVALW